MIVLKKLKALDAGQGLGGPVVGYGNGDAHGGSPPLSFELLGGADAAQKIVERVGVVDVAAGLGLVARDSQTVDAENGADAGVVGSVGVVAHIADDGKTGTPRA